MAKPLKALWIKAALTKLAILQHNLGIRKSKKKDMAELAELIPMARSSKTEEGRAKAHVAVFQVRILEIMRKYGLFEKDSKRSFVMLKPNLKMKNGDEGKNQYEALVKKYGQPWADTNVTKIDRDYPEVKVKVGTFENGIFKMSTETIDAHTETEYLFVGEGRTVNEELKWTEVLGNNITIDVSDIPARFKQGKARKGK